MAEEDTGRLIQQAGQVGLLPGSVEVGINGKDIRIENVGLAETRGGVAVGNYGDGWDNPVTARATEYGGQIEPDPSKYVVTYNNIRQDLDDPVLAWRSRNRYHTENLFGVLDEVNIDFNGPEDHWYVALSLFKGRHFVADQVTKVVLGVSHNIGHIDLFRSDG